MEIRRIIYVGVLTGLLASVEACAPKDPVIETINSSGKKIARIFNEKTLVPAQPDRIFISRMSESIGLLRGARTQKGGLRMSIDKAMTVVLERPVVDSATFSCISEVAAATGLPLSRLEQVSDEEGAYLLRIVVDAGVTIAYRNGRTPQPCPYIKENLDS